MFNNPEGACRTCSGLGVHKLTHPELLVPDPNAQHPRRLFRDAKRSATTPTPGTGG